MSQAILYARWGAYTAGTLTAWWLMTKTALLAERIIRERRRRR